MNDPINIAWLQKCGRFELTTPINCINEPPISHLLHCIFQKSDIFFIILFLANLERHKVIEKEITLKLICGFNRLMQKILSTQFRPFFVVTITPNRVLFQKNIQIIIIFCFSSFLYQSLFFSCFNLFLEGGLKLF